MKMKFNADNLLKIRIMIKKLLTIKKLFFENTLVFIICLIIFNLTIIKIPFHRFFDFFLPYDISINLSKVVQSLLIILISIFFIKSFSLNDFAGIKLWRIKNATLLAIPFIYPMILGYSNLSLLNKLQIDFNSILIVLAALIAKGMAEEISFRGLLQSYLLKKFAQQKSVLGIVILTSIIFALMHIINIRRYSFVDIINQVIIAFFFGVFFGAFLLRTRNIYIIGIIHGLINFIFGIKTIFTHDISSNDNYIYSYSEIIFEVFKITLLFSPLLVIGILLLKGISKFEFTKVENNNSK